MGTADAATERRRSSAFGALASAVVVVDEHGEIRDLNAAAEALLGTRPARMDRVLLPPTPRCEPPTTTELSLAGVDGPVDVEASITALGDPPGWTVWVLRDLSNHRLREAELVHRASHDVLTGLPNRATFLEQLGVALRDVGRTDRGLAVLFLDLDRFKLVNDRLGHDAGDQLLVEATQRVLSVMRAGDTLARFAGDEFVMLCRDVSQVVVATRVADRVIEVLGQPFDLQAGEGRVSSSVGISMLEPDEMDRIGDDSLTELALTLVDRADAALYRAKEGGRARWELYDEDLQRWAARRQELEIRLRTAVEDGTLSLSYQPVVRIETGEVRSLEALLRWSDDDGGVVSPDLFIAIAEDTGLIVPIGDWVLEEAGRQLQRIDERFPGSGLVMAVNVSARQLAEPDYARRAAERVRRLGLDPHRIRLEITETVLFGDAEEAVSVLTELKEAGFLLAMDDFGTGYSSMTYLRRFPLDTVKVDKAFVARCHESNADSTIVAMVVALARALNLGVVAEGVETFEQSATLFALRCAEGQGYLYSEPLPGPEILEWLAEALPSAHRRSVPQLREV